MPTDYSDHDTEQVRIAERSSAGQQTVTLAGFPNTPPPASLEAPPLAQPARRNNALGLGLVGLGVVLLLSRFFDLPRLELEGGMVILTIASCFLFFALWRRIFGLFIPGALLAGIAVGVTFADLTNGVSVLWGLALGFLTIMGLGRSLFGVNSSWAIYPAVPLFAAGCIVAVTSLGSVIGLGVIWLPLLLIIAGFYLGFVRKSA